jgi:hypothetical protein
MNRLFLLGSILFLIAITIVLSLIPVYLSKHGSNINGNNGLGMFYEMIIIRSFVC